MGKNNKKSNLKFKSVSTVTKAKSDPGDELEMDITEQLAHDSGSEDVISRPGEADSDEDDSDEVTDTRKLVMQQNRKKKKSGGFQSMGLSHFVFKGVTRKGYKIPTPIQRKTIPIIMDGKDVVAMARTGSGKTAAFLIPMFEKLKTHTAKSGARALIMSPTRELALQTLKFTKELGKFTSLRAALVLGGDKLEDQFAALHENPDIIIATPGRFLHVVMEMDMKLSAVEYIVFDEADRLFEMGFQEQLEEIIKRLPDSRQTLLFSATLPKLLVDFAKAGLHDPTLIRLDVDTKLSENLQLAFLQCRDDDKPALLLHLLQNVISPKAQTVVFAATKHHVEFLNMLLKEAGISCAYIYSALDQTARKIHVAKFQKKQTMVLIVTDLAARGIDIPMLDNVINYHFPGKSKLFVHRVGRVARAGRSGMAYSLVAQDEIPYVLDLHLFLGRPMKYATTSSKKDDDGIYGRAPQTVVDDEDDNIRKYLANNSDLKGQFTVSEKAMKQYQRSRPAPSNESIKRMKERKQDVIAIHPVFGDVNAEEEDSRTRLLESMKAYRPNNTIFEINTSNKNTAFSIMKSKRNMHQGAIEGRRTKQKERAEKLREESSQDGGNITAEMSSENDLQDAFKRVVAPKVSKFGFDESHKKKKKKDKKLIKDEEFYIPYRPKDFDSEKGLSLSQGFHQQTQNAMLDMTGDDADEMRRQQKQVQWDRKRKKFVDMSGRDGPTKKKIRTESGVWIPATYKSNVYKQWVQKTKTGEQEPDDDSDTEHKPRQRGGGVQVMGGGVQVMGGGHRGRKGFHQGSKASRKKQEEESNVGGKRAKKYEMKSKEHIAKQRLKKESLQTFMKKRQITRAKRKASFGHKNKSSRGKGVSSRGKGVSSRGKGASSHGKGVSSGMKRRR